LSDFLEAGITDANFHCGGIDSGIGVNWFGKFIRIIFGDDSFSYGTGVAENMTTYAAMMFSAEEVEFDITVETFFHGVIFDPFI